MSRNNGHNQPTPKMMSYLKKLSPETYKQAQEENWSGGDVHQTIDALKNEQLNGNGHHTSNSEQKPLEVFHTITGNSILSSTYAQRQWIIDNILPEGLGTIVADPKTGKSLLILTIILHLVQMFEAYDIEGDILYLCMEDEPIDIQERLWSQLQGTSIDLSRVHFGFNTEGVMY